MDLSFNLAPSYRDLKDPTTRQNFDDTVEQKRVIDLRACLIFLPIFNHLAQAPLSTQASSLSKTKNSCFTAESSPVGKLEMTKSKSFCRQMTAAEN